MSDPVWKAQSVREAAARRRVFMHESKDFGLRQGDRCCYVTEVFIDGKWRCVGCSKIL